MFRTRVLRSIFGPREPTLKWAGDNYTVKTFVCLCICVYIYLYIYVMPVALLLVFRAVIDFGSYGFVK